jgi:hypothetical protein
MNRADRRAAAVEAARGFPAHLIQVPRSDWPEWPFGTEPPVEVWRSRRFLVQVFALAAGGAVARLSVVRVDRADGIAWDELRAIKREVGLGSSPAVEYFPPDAEVVNRANMRHVVILDAPPPWAWRPR